MKTKIYLSLFVLLTASLLQAQNLDDAIRFNQYELTGTSRSLGMANAFGALGGDLTAISINPAGIAVYRSSEFAFTPSLSINQTTADYQGYSSKDDKWSFPFNQIGGVATYKSLREREQGIISTHFGFTYNRTADFNNNTNMMLGEGVIDDYNTNPLTANTLLTNIMLEANGYTTETMSDRAYWAYNNYLIDPVFDESTEYYSHYEAIDEAEGIIFNRNIHGIRQKFLSESSGYSGEYGFTFGTNISNVFLLGASLNFQSFKLDQKESFREINTGSFDPAFDNDLDYYDIYSNLHQDGFGVNSKLGMIVNLHPIRIGASIHSPTFYSIEEEYYEGIDSYFLNYDHYYAKSDIYDFSYNYRTPYRVEVSASFVLKQFALFSFDYEMTDHKSSKITPRNGFERVFDDLNREIDRQFKTTHNIRAGVEVKPLPYLALRGGAAYYDSPFKDNMTDIKMDKWIGTVGFGVKNKNFFFDMAYAHTFYDDGYNINPYISDTEQAITHPLVDPVSFEGIKLSNKKHQVSFTFGWKF